MKYYTLMKILTLVYLMTCNYTVHNEEAVSTPKYSDTNTMSINLKCSYSKSYVHRPERKYGEIIMLVYEIQTKYYRFTSMLLSSVITRNTRKPKSSGSDHMIYDKAHECKAIIHTNVFVYIQYTDGQARYHAYIVSVFTSVASHPKRSKSVRASVGSDINSRRIATSVMHTGVSMRTDVLSHTFLCPRSVANIGNNSFVQIRAMLIFHCLMSTIMILDVFEQTVDASQHKPTVETYVNKPYLATMPLRNNVHHGHIVAIMVCSNNIDDGLCIILYGSGKDICQSCLVHMVYNELREFETLEQTNEFDGRK